MTNKFAILFFLMGLIINVYAQKTFMKNHPDESFIKGVELFEKEKYGLSNIFMQEYINENPNNSLLIFTDAKYFASICALELFNSNAELKVADFIANNPENSRIPDASFRLGIFNFRQRKYKKVINAFEKVDPYYLNNDQTAEYYFKKGYSYFAIDNYEEASKSLFEIRNWRSKYSIPAKYFYSHIAYISGNYEIALQGFMELKEDEMFSPIIPYYITHIYFLQEKYDMVIDYTPPMLDSVNIKRKPEIARLLGESYYRTRHFKEAIPHLEMYINSGNQLSKEDYYQLGFCCWVTGNFNKSIEMFKRIALIDDEFSQNTAYLLGGAYVNTNKKKSARLAFETAYKINANPTITEHSLLNFAKLTHELSITPFNEAINAFNLFIERFPESDYVDEAYDGLARVFITTRNYQEAIEVLENIKTITPDIEEAYQRVTFFRAMELFNNSDFKNAVILFDKSLNNAKYNKLFHARSLYWKGEAYYRLHRYENAINEFHKFLVSSGAFDLDEYNKANYNLAYAYFKTQKYREAITWFRKYADNVEDKNLRTVGDAYARVGDCYYISRDYDNAIYFYQRAIDNGKASPDYAMFQKGFTLGLQRNHAQKIITLNQLITTYPRSAYVDDAYFEIGNSYVAMEETDMAINSFRMIIDDYPSSNLVPRSYLQIGLVNYNADRNDEALYSLKQLIENFSNTRESIDGLNALKNIYLDMNKVDDYFTYLKNKGRTDDIRISEKDSLMYTSAERVYMSGECKKSIELFEKYIENFDDKGIFYVNSNYYLAECLMQTNRIEDAMRKYEKVVTKQGNQFVEPALVRLANYNYKNNDYEKAIKYYSNLFNIAQYDNNKYESQIGIMRANYRLNNYSKAKDAAIWVLKTGKISDEIYREAHFIIGKEAFYSNNLEDALDEFKLIAKECKSMEESEAKYLIARIYYIKEKFDLAESEVFDFVKKNTPHQFWLAKSFLLLADIFIGKNDFFQAKATLSSIIDNYNNNEDGIVNEAKVKLAEIDLLENPPVEIKSEILDENIEKVELDTSLPESDFEITIESEKK